MAISENISLKSGNFGKKKFILKWKKFPQKNCDISLLVGIFTNVRCLSNTLQTFF
jgi:hypothetical protein